MGNNILKFVWRINNTAIEEEFDLSNYEDQLNERGTIAEEISLACMAKLMVQNIKLFSFDLAAILDLTEDSNSGFYNAICSEIKQMPRKKYNKRQRTCLNFDILERSVWAYVRHIIELRTDTQEYSESNDDFIKSVNKIFCLSTLDKDYANNDFEDAKKAYADFFEAMKKSNISEAYYCDKKPRKCVAIYKKYRHKEYTIAFSGLKDYHETVKFGATKMSPSDRCKFIKIAEQVHAELASTSLEISRYSLNKDGTISRYDTLNDVIQGKATNIEYHHCCERKIYAHLSAASTDKETVYGGVLCVKYSPCSECTLATLYHIINKNQQFQMYVGMPEKGKEK